IMEETYGYISIILGGMTISMCYNICASVLRAMGDTVMPLLFLIFSAFFNIFLDRFFMIELHTGVQGAAYATLISQFLSCILCFFYIYIRYPILRLKRCDFAFHRSMIKEMYASGASMGFMMSLVSLGTLALQSAINTLGTSIIIAHTAARKITELYMMLFSVLGTTMATYSGQNLGAGNVHRIKDGIRKAIKAAWIWSVGVILITWLFAPQLIRLLTSTTDPEVIQNAVNYLRFDTAFYFVPSMITIIRNTMQGIGDYKTPIISSSIELIGKILVALFLAPALHYFGIILAEPIVWILMVIPLILRIKTTPILKETAGV
ncbi:MAG: MATE family efflux transporter, partial [Lachnospiraceae bacterium]|nr:MATE family efflux transporter [Lachnospiraceae bacterium]